MQRDEIQERIRNLSDLIERDAGYNVPTVRVQAEQTLAMWAIASVLSEVLAELTTIRQILPFTGSLGNKPKLAE